MNIKGGNSKISRRDRIGGGIMIAVLILATVYVFVKNDQRNNLLRNSCRTTAIIREIKHGAVRSPKRVEFTYSVNGQSYEESEPGDYDDFKVGDTILIEFAKKDHSVARVVDKYYMKKNKHLQKEEIVR